MKRHLLFVAMAMATLLTSCYAPGGSSSEEVVANPVDTVNLTSSTLTPEALWAFGRIGGVEVSPDKTTLLFSASFYDVEANTGNSELFIIPVEGGEPENIARTRGGEYNAQWRPDGQKIGYLSAESGAMQLWEMNPDGTKRTQISDIEGGINGFKYAPDMKKILFTKQVKLDQSTLDRHPDLPKATGRVETDLMYRHWDQWHDYKYSHVFIADYNGTSLSNATDIMEGEPFDSPLEPFGGMEQINWSPDSKQIVYTCKKLSGKDYAVSTNSDIYLYNLASKETKNLSKGMMGYDKAAVFSPDGSMLAWESMERDGYESDKNRLFVYTFATGEKKEYTTDFDQNVHGLTWSDDNQYLYFTSDYHARFQAYRIAIPGGNIEQLTEGIHNYLSAIPVGDKLIGTKQSMSKPTEVYSVNMDTKEETQLSHINKHLLDQLKMGEVKKRWVKTTDGKEMLVWVIYPPNFDPNKKYPTLLYCQGGPQSSVSQFFSYRWNFQMMAANDYIIVAPNRRGLPSFGQEWNEQISGDYGGQNMKDYLTAIDNVAKEPYVDNDNLGAVGASYGGFSVFWLAGNHDGRFDAFIAHDGIFNLEAQYLETEELFFANWDLGGPYWDKANKETYDNSPHRFVDKWDTPLMVVHGEQDFRITYTQSMAAFNAAQILDIPSKLLFFPDENHWVLKPQNGIMWQREYFSWLDKWLKDKE
ncbi:MAG: S9 family peptidase [Bacteroidales bacterium]